ncbi:MAG: hypothetical protein DHS20C12_15950 [Pseudohongiella sp.]|nr:MAG: hypothetical protein DHS20C12_15950 [Pseudohongiella sp.]
MRRNSLWVGLAVCLASNSLFSQALLNEMLTRARSVDGSYISWREHIIDDPEIAGFALSGSDGLVMGDIDKDGFEDIVSVHEFDAEYDSAEYQADFVPPPEGHVRIAFASRDPNVWHNITIAEGTDAPAPEDAVVVDLNGDGYLDVVAAAEQSHLIYLQNPGANARTAEWPRLILPMTQGKGSYIRVFAGDFDGDGIPELTAPNKGAQSPGPADFARSTPVELYKLTGDPLQGSSWQGSELGRYSVPQNAEPVDLDGDGDLDIVVGARGDNRLVFFENTDPNTLEFEEHAIGMYGTSMAGFNLEYSDLNGDGRLDIIGGGSGRVLYWAEQPERITDTWNAFEIGTISPDNMVGMEIADIDGDGDTDVMVGSYSRGPRTGDGDVDVNDALGRLAWFENPGEAKGAWTRHDISRRKRGMFDKFIARDVDGDGDMDFLGTRGNSAPYDGVYWLEQVRSANAMPNFLRARAQESDEIGLPF